MKREDVTKIFEGATDEQINSILNINCADIGKAKADYEEIKNELAASKETAQKLTGELDLLKKSNASSEDWKKKFDDLSAEIAIKEAAANAEREKAEREADIKSRYNAVCVDKNGNPLIFAHEAIKNDYLKKFTEALESESYAGKSDADIFHALTKDDANAFKGVSASVNLVGARAIDQGALESSRARAIMGLN